MDLKIYEIKTGENNDLFTVVDLRQKIVLTTKKDNIEQNFCSICANDILTLEKCSICGDVVCEHHFNNVEKVCCFCEGFYSEKSEIPNG